MSATRAPRRAADQRRRDGHDPRTERSDGSSGTVQRSPGHDPSSAEHRFAWIVLALVAVVFLAASWSTITAPFGDSDEGINGAVWGYNSRSVRELGPIESRLGGVRIDATKYATHPPLIVVETAVIERLVGEHPWSTRAAAWLGALATIPLLYLLVRALSLSPAAAATATATTLLCHFFIVYGSMLDTMIIAFPIAIAVLLVWYRDWIGERSVHPIAVAALATIAALGGWQAMFLVGLCGVAHLGRWRARRGRAFAAALPYLGGAALGLALTLGWAMWVFGSFAVLNDKLIRRTGGEAVTLADMVSFQIPWLTQLLGLGFLAWIACAVSLRDRRFRPVAALSLASVVLYAAFLKEGSGGHQYWNYWGLLPAAIGIAYLVGKIDLGLVRQFGSTATPRLLGLVAVVVVAATINLVQPNQAGEMIERGVNTYEVVDRSPFLATQDRIPYIGEPYRIDDWLRYRGGPPGDPIESADELHALASQHPDWMVVVLGPCPQPDPTEICERANNGIGSLGFLRLERADQLAQVVSGR